MEPRRVLSPQWRQLYQAAILETVDDLLPQRILAAEAAISDRMDVLNLDPDNTYDERDVLTNAYTVLRCLRLRLAEKGAAA